MLLQLGAIFQTIGSSLLDFGLGALQTFTNKEIQRNQTKRDEDFLQLRAKFGAAAPAQFVSQAPAGGGFGLPLPTVFAATNGTRRVGPSRIPPGGVIVRGSRFTRTLDGCNVQHFRFDGTDFVTLDSAPQLTGRKWRFDEMAKNSQGTLGKFVPVPGRRMNPINPRAMRRSVTRIKRGQVICRDILKILGHNTSHRRSTATTNTRGVKKK